jgi:hypothetical protein
VIAEVNRIQLHFFRLWENRRIRSSARTSASTGPDRLLPGNPAPLVIPILLANDLETIPDGFTGTLLVWMPHKKKDRIMLL